MCCVYVPQVWIFALYPFSLSVFMPYMLYEKFMFRERFPLCIYQCSGLCILTPCVCCTIVFGFLLYIINCYARAKSVEP